MKIAFNSNFPNDFLVCQSCGKNITNLTNGQPAIPYQELYKNGNIPIPNFGWICSQECAEKFEKENDIRFNRNKEGKIDYYNGSLDQ